MGFNSGFKGLIDTNVNRKKSIMMSYHYEVLYFIFQFYE